MLCQTYDYNLGMIGNAKKGIPLSPVAHTIANAHVEVIINLKGEFLDASTLTKEVGKTLIPVSEKSEGRSGTTIAPHPLSDTLSYIAGDFASYAHGDKLKRTCTSKYLEYIKKLEQWVTSQHTHEKVQAIYQYLMKSELIQDLVKVDIVSLNVDGKLDDKKIAGNPYEKVLLRFVVVGSNNISTKTWEDTSLINAYTRFYAEQQVGKKDICYISGIRGVTSVIHPKGIVSASNSAKLISANDDYGYTYRGRFSEAEQACTISYEASQKSHRILSWLASNQGIIIGSMDKRTYICWNPNGKEIPSIEDPVCGDFVDEEDVPTTEPEFKKRLINALYGNIDGLRDNDDIVIVGLDAATTGRLSVTYYNELKASDFLKRLENWCEECNWLSAYFMSDKKQIIGIQTPSPQKIVRYAFGVERSGYIDLNDKILKEQIQRIYYCILDGHAFPNDILQALVNKASNPQCYSKEKYRELLSVTCAAIKKKKIERQENVQMKLDESNVNRSYLFGRLLAVAEKVEEDANKVADISRLTNAKRLQSTYVNYPMRTLMILENALLPYVQRLDKGAQIRYEQLKGQIYQQIMQEDESMLNRPLDENYLLGYYLQKNEFYMKNSDK